MAVTISGTNGIAVPLGSASAPAETNTTSSTTGIYYPTSTTLGLSTNGTNAVTIDASQNVGIGTTSPIYKLQVAQATAPIIGIKNTSASGTSGNAAYMVLDCPQGVSTFYRAILATADSGTNYDWGIGNFGTSTKDVLAFYSGGLTERMRIDSSGNLLVGTTAAGLSNSSSFTFQPSSQYSVFNKPSGSVSGAYYIYFGYNAGTIGSITQNGTTGVLFNTASDYRLKENVQPMTTGLATISALKPVSYNWISDKSRGEGFIAHELQEIIPGAVTGKKDDVDKDGKIQPQGVDYSKIVVHLVAAIKELSAEVEALKAKVGA